MLVAAPLGYAVASVASDGLGTFLAFAIGAFPLSTVQRLLQRIGNKSFKLDLGATDSADAAEAGQVIALDGIDLPTAERLEAADITTVAQLAYCDPVQLAMRTNLAFDAVTDLVNQALAFLYFKTDLDKLRPRGLRGAIEINEFVKNAPPQTDPEVVILATVLSQEPVTLLRAFRQISDDPYTLFLVKAWGR